MDPNNLLGIPETLLPEDPAAAAVADAMGPHDGTPTAQALAAVAVRYPASALAWALMSDVALEEGRIVEAYAFARTGYHRSLDQLRRAGWRGQGPVPWSHEPNRGFLRSLAALSRASEQVDDTEEASRCANFLRESSPEGAAALGL